MTLRSIFNERNVPPSTIAIFVIYALLAKHRICAGCELLLLLSVPAHKPSSQHAHEVVLKCVLSWRTHNVSYIVAPERTAASISGTELDKGVRCCLLGLHSYEHNSAARSVALEYHSPPRPTFRVDNKRGFKVRRMRERPIHAATENSTG